MDLRAAKTMMVSSMYYKAKLQVHNFTLFNLDSKKAYCCFQNEDESDLKNEGFTYLQYHDFETMISENPTLRELGIWSDGCGNQNSNVTIAIA